MAGFLKSMFGRRTEASKQGLTLSYDQIKGMPFDKVLILANSLTPQTMSFGSAEAILRRLLQIALFDNHIPEEQRGEAKRLADALETDLEQSLANNADGLSALKTAITQMHFLAKQGGYGSLIWQLNEYPMPAAETVPFVMRSDHRHLVPDFLEALGPESVGHMKPHMVRQLILQANYNSKNSVLILHGLVSKADKAAAAIFSSDEYWALLNVPRSYAEGREVLVGLEVLPAINDVVPFKPVSEIKNLLELLHDLLWKTHKRAEGDPRVTGLSEDKKHALLLTLDFLRVDLTRAALCQIYGEEAAYDIVTIFGDVDVAKELNRFKEVTQIIKDMAPGTPVEWALLDAVMSSGGVAAKSEEEFNNSADYFNLAVAWLNNERVEYLDCLRSMLRKMPDVEEDRIKPE